MNFLKQFNLKLLAVFLSAVLIIAGATVVQAQTSTPSAEPAAKYNVTFPISELNNCASPSECREYCEDPIHRATCVEFAKKKGFYKEPKEKIQNAEILEKAKSELGCENPQACKELCEQEANFEKCSDFAKKYNLGPPPKESDSSEALAKAKAELGCDSPESCKTFCELEENEEKCSEFAKKNNFKGGERKTGPGGCTSEESCKAFCSDPENFELCSNYQTLQGKQGFTGPGGCDSPESCKAYCEQNPSECPNLEDDSEEVEDEADRKEKLCKRTPQCSWEDDKCSCKSFAGMSTPGSDEQKVFCVENSDKCENGVPKIKPEEYCQRYPDKCKGGFEPKKHCTQKGSCQWSDEENICKCENKSGNGIGEFSSKSAEFNPNRGPSDNRGSRDQNKPLISPGVSVSPGFNKEEVCKRNPNCKWDNGACKCEPRKLSITPSAAGFVKPSGMPQNVVPSGMQQKLPPPSGAPQQQFMLPPPSQVPPTGTSNSGSVKPPQEFQQLSPKPDDDDSNDDDEDSPDDEEEDDDKLTPAVQGAYDNGRIPLINFLRSIFF